MFYKEALERVVTQTTITAAMRARTKEKNAKLILKLVMMDVAANFSIGREWLQ
jgi:hypothetical protein